MNTNKQETHKAKINAKRHEMIREALRKVNSADYEQKGPPYNYKSWTI